LGPAEGPLVTSKSQWIRTTQTRFESVIAEPALASSLNVPWLETRTEHFLRAIQTGAVSTNLILRRAHNFALEIRWLPWPIMTTTPWPPIRFGERRGITREEHEKFVASEKDPERRAFYEPLASFDPHHGRGRRLIDLGRVV
jgi:hypothetical protein